MHELSLLKDLLGKVATLAARNSAERVIGVKVKLGALAHISADHFREHFVRAAVGTPVEGVKLEIEELTDPTDPHAQDLILDSIEVVEQ